MSHHSHLEAAKQSYLKDELQLLEEKMQRVRALQAGANRDAGLSAETVQRIHDCCQTASDHLERLQRADAQQWDDLKQNYTESAAELDHLLATWRV